MSQREQAIQVLNLIEEKDLGTILDILRHYVPIDPDDILTPEELADCERAVEEYHRGEYVSSDDIDWN